MHKYASSELLIQLSLTIFKLVFVERATGQQPVRIMFAVTTHEFECVQEIEVRIVL